MTNDVAAAVVADGEGMRANNVGSDPSATGARVGKFRWTICTLLFFAATVNYIDRQVIGILKPTLSESFGWSELDYSWIVFSFQTAYAIGLFFAGKLMDRIERRSASRSLSLSGALPLSRMHGDRRSA